jgi:hypothetical protein
VGSDHRPIQTVGKAPDAVAQQSAYPLADRFTMGPHQRGDGQGEVEAREDERASRLNERREREQRAASKTLMAAKASRSRRE